MTEHKPLTAWAEKMLRELDDADLRDLLHRQGPATVHHPLATLDAARAAREAAERERDIQIQGNCRLSNDLEALTADRDRLAAECESLRAALQGIKDYGWDAIEPQALEALSGSMAPSESGAGGLLSDRHRAPNTEVDRPDNASSTRAAAEVARLAGKGGSDAKPE